MRGHDARDAPVAAAVVSAWLVFLLLDFLAHAVILAAWWRATEAYWLPPMELFKRIPFGDAAFALFVVGVMLQNVFFPTTADRIALREAGDVITIEGYAYGATA